MFEARLTQGSLLKRLMDVVKDIVDNGNFDCTTSGFGLQAMDLSHVSLVSMMLHSDSFDHYRCDRNISLGFNMKSLAKCLKCAGDGDVVSMKARSWTCCALGAVLARGSSVACAYCSPRRNAHLPHDAAHA